MKRNRYKKKEYRFELSGDRGLSVVFEQMISIQVNNRVAALKQLLDSKNITGIETMVAAYCSLLIVYDDAVISLETLKSMVINCVGRTKLGEISGGQIHHVPVRYGGECGTDLEEVAEHNRISVDDVIKIHSSRDYHVFMLGFSPGFPYLGGMDECISTPRRSTPRLSVPAGSVGIAGSQTGVYPQTSPGGWQIIGQTDVSFFDMNREQPFLVEAGDTIRFEPIETKDIANISGALATPTEVGQEAVLKQQSSKVQAISAGNHGGIEVINPGMFTTIQDQGRLSYLSYGVPISGAMDRTAINIGNLLLGNDEHAAGLEMTYLGGSYLFHEECLICLTGSGAEASVTRSSQPQVGQTKRTEPILLWQTYKMRKGDVLEIKSIKDGIRTYLCVNGGIDVPKVLGSRSTYLRGQFGGVDGRQLRKSDRLAIGQQLNGNIERNMKVINQGRFAPKEVVESLRKNRHKIRVIEGPQSSMFTKQGVEAFFTNEYTVTEDNDRMGYRLKGSSVEHVDSADIISDGLMPGAIQVPPHGQPIIMLADGQPTGGYAKIGYVVSTDLWKIAQSRQGDKIKFYRCSVEESHEINNKRRASMKLLKDEIGHQELTPVRKFCISVEGKTYDVAVQEIM